MILCCGEALIDMIPTVSTTGARAFEPHPGGSVFNTAVALGRLGATTGFLSGLSTDQFGVQLSQALVESNVDTTTAIITDRPTALAFVQLNDGQANYIFYDENSAGRWMTTDQLPEIPHKISTLYFGGISLIGGPCSDFYAALAVRESANRVVMLDPNIRVSMVEDEEKYRTRLKRMLLHSDIVKVSDEDLAWIIDDPNDLISEARAIQKMGPKLVIVTRGAKGALVVTQDKNAVEVPAQPVSVVDTVGAGDTFNAGVHANLAQNRLLTKQALARVGTSEIQEAVKFGAKVAAKTVSRSGADSPWASELEATH